MASCECNNNNYYCAGMDYIFNEGVSTDIVFPADLMILELPLEIIDDNKIEDEESVTVFFNAAVNVPGLDITISPPSITIKISDNDGMSHKRQFHYINYVTGSGKRDTQISLLSYSQTKTPSK